MKYFHSQNFREHLKPRIELDFDQDLKTLRVWTKVRLTIKKITITFLKGLGTRRKQFVAEISPPAETTVEILESCSAQLHEAGDIEMLPLKESTHTACFTGLKDSITYSLTVWRVLAGKKIIGTTRLVKTTAVGHKGLYPRLN